MSRFTQLAVVAVGAMIALTFSGCATYRQPPHETEIARYIKTLANRYPASTTVVNGETLYEIILFNPPRGYQTVYTLTERKTDATLTVSIFEALGGAQRLTLLVDDSVDGNIDYYVTAAARSMRDALETARSGGGTVSYSVLVVQPVYKELLRDLREEVVVASARW